MIDEDARLSGAPSRQVEFITTCRYLDRYITPGARVLDLGAGTGAYSLYLAEPTAMFLACNLQLRTEKNDLL